MTKINSNPPQNFHYIFLMHRFMIFKRSVQYANFFFVSVYMLLFPDFTTLVCCFLPPTPWNAENAWSQSMPRCHFLVSWYLGFESNLEDSSPCLKGEWLSVQTGGGGIRAGRGARGQPFALHLFPCTTQALWSCWKIYFLYHFVWLNNHLQTSVSALQQIRVQKSYFYLMERWSYC